MRMTTKTRTSPKKMPENEPISFWDHLEEFRRLLFKSLVAVLVLSTLLFFFLPNWFDSILLGPCFGDFPTYRLFCQLGRMLGWETSFCASDYAIQLINIQLTAQFMLHIQTAVLFGFLFSIPYLLFALWSFVQPALYPNEQRAVRWAFTGSSLLFYAGVTLSYFIIFPVTLRFLAGYQISQHVINQLALTSYIQTLFTLSLIMGIVFEMPLLAWTLSQLGLLKRSFFKRWRRHAVVILMILAAFITPTGDPLTLLLVALPLYALYELSARVVKP